MEAGTIHKQDWSPDRIAHWKSRFGLVAQRQIFRPITETKSWSWELMLLIIFLDKYLWPQQVWNESIKRYRRNELLKTLT